MLVICVPLFLAGGNVFSLAVGFLGVLSLKELLDLKKSHHKIPSALVLFSALALVSVIFYEYQGSVVSYGISHRLLIVILGGYLLPTLFLSKKEYDTSDAFYLFGVVIFLGLCFHSLIIIRAKNIYLLGYLLLVAIVTDVFAYCIGSLIGKHKLALDISPNKTIEGLVSGLICSGVICSSYYYLFVDKKNILLLFLLSVFLSFVGQLGDLVFSKIKRENGIKDFSKLIPGHGGILDRLDSVLFILLVYFVFMKIL